MCRRTLRLSWNNRPQERLFPPRQRRPAAAGALLLFAICAAAALLSAALPAAAADAKNAAAELEAITGKLNALDTWLDDADRRRVRLQRELEASDREVAAVSARLDEATKAGAAAEAALAALQKEADALRAEQARQARHIANHVAAAHRLAGEDFFKLLLNQESPETFDRMVRYHRYFTAARIATLDEYRRTLAQLAENEAQLEARATDAEALRAERQERQAELFAGQEERKAVIAKLAVEAEDKAIERERLRADRERLETLLAELERKALKLDGRTFARSQGKLPWPLKGRVIHGFGNPRAGGRLTWNGILVAADEGATFRAVHAGRVVFADWLRGFGLMTIVDHGSGYMTLYGQADALARKAGDQVQAGDVLGRAGRSGGQKDAGLYFEVRRNGRAQDPAAWLARH